MGWRKKNNICLQLRLFLIYTLSLWSIRDLEKWKKSYFKFNLIRTAESQVLDDPAHAVPTGIGSRNSASDTIS